MIHVSGQLKTLIDSKRDSGKKKSMDDPDLTTPGGRLRFARQLRDLTQSELGDMVSLDRQSVYRHEATSAISRKAAAKYAKALNVSEVWLLYRDGPDPGVRLTDALEAYFDSDLGRTTQAPVRELLRRVSYSSLGVHQLDLATVHRVRELIEMNRVLGAQKRDGGTYRTGSAA
jgi:transcriptional regulator with XRE-family HTH domain